MSRAYSATAAAANSRGAEQCTDSAVTCTISDLIRAKYPTKTWSFIASMFGLQERTAKHRLAGTRVYTVSELQILLRSEDGAEVLEALMADAKPRWWAGVEAAIKIANARHHQELARQAVLSLDSAPLEMPTRRKIKRTVDADRHLSCDVAKEETTLGLFLANGGRAAVGAVAETARKIQAAGAGRAAGGRGR